MIALVLALSLATAPACVGDGHNRHRSKSAIKRFQKTWARAHGGMPCPEECAVYRKVAERFVICQRCPLACCGLDAPQNMQWLTAEANRAKSDDCSSCGPAR